MLTSFMIRYEFTVSAISNILRLIRSIREYVVFVKYSRPNNRIEIICKSDYELLRVQVSINTSFDVEYYDFNRLHNTRVIDVEATMIKDVEAYCGSDSCRETYHYLSLSAGGELALVVDTSNSDNLQEKLKLLRAVLEHGEINRVLVRPM